MLSTFILAFFIFLGNILTSIFGSVDVLPFGMDAILVSAVGSFKAFIHIFPPAQIVFNAFMIYISFRFVLLVMKLILGSRAPHIS